VPDQAVVLGSGIAGLTVAAVLAEQFTSVRVVERDRLSDSPCDRRGAPQGRHLHSLLSRGSQVFDELLPGFLADLTAAGAPVLADRDLGRIYTSMGRYTFNRSGPLAEPEALAVYQASRPFLEFHLRQRVAALPPVTFLDGHDIGEFIAARPGRITGVTVTDRLTGRTRSLEADLVVDATGRATRTPLLLEQLGYPHVPRHTFTTNGIYHSQQILIPGHHEFRERIVLVLPEGGSQRGGLVACENDTWTLTIAGRADDLSSTPTDFAEICALARDFMPAHIQPAVERSRPISDVATYRYPGGVWRRYDQMPHYPRGLLVLGDALCCLDPINGQGMTMAALHADRLHTHLRNTPSVDPSAFYSDLAALITPIWTANAAPASAHSTTSRTASLANRARGWTRAKILEAAADDIVITEQLSRVANLIDPPKRLLEPAFLARVLTHHTRRTLTRRPQR
jgi:2-polyprenyl-6-methoxyphenol hydroxylase-like FAD-dependent oxidoreductase